MTLAEFLLARIAEDEAVALAVDADLKREFGHSSSELSSDLQSAGNGPMDYPVLTIDPTRVLAECAAKRAIVGLHADDLNETWSFDPDVYLCLSCDEASPCVIVRHLATVYADHPDYRDEWRP